ncbi:MAG: hypothetical protein KHX91_08860 [Clostridium sp.]|nr:hypothetical protein [Clostridium sp.]
MESVFADVGTEKVNNGDFLDFLGRKLWLKNKKEKLSQRDKIIGYIPCENEAEEEGYIRIVKTSNNIIIIPIILSLLIIGGIIGGIIAVNQNSRSFLDQAAISYQMPNGIKNENPNEIMIPVFTELVRPAGSNKVAAGLVNPEGNPCYFQYSIYLKENEQLLYESKWIEPGTAIMEFEIMEQLQVGEYPIEIRIKTGSLNDLEVEMNGGEIDAVLRVE